MNALRLMLENGLESFFLVIAAGLAFSWIIGTILNAWQCG